MHITWKMKRFNIFFIDILVVDYEKKKKEGREERRKKMI